jgi:ABC-type multidrug transport system ATPase subunit
MLTICRTLMGDPDLITINEPTEGLAPQMMERISELLQEIARRGISILLVERRLVIAMHISHRIYVMGEGRMVFSGAPADLKANDAAPGVARSVETGRDEKQVRSMLGREAWQENRRAVSMSAPLPKSGRSSATSPTSVRV